MKTIGVVLAAGFSIRFNSESHKQYLKLNGKEVIYYSVDAMKRTPEIDEILVVVDEKEYKEQYISKKYHVNCTPGGKTRNESIKNAIDYIKNNFDADVVVFCDSSRPFIGSVQISKCISYIKEFDAVAVASPISDGLLSKKFQNIERDDFELVRTPEVVRFKLLSEQFDMNNPSTTIIGQLTDCNKYLYHSNAYNFKITYPEDLFLAEQLVRISYESSKNHTQNKIAGKVLLLGGSGGVGECIKRYLDDEHIKYAAPTHHELDMEDITVQKIIDYMPFKPDIIINASAAYANDDTDILESFNKIMNVNVKSNLVLIKYAETINKKVNIVCLSSSSCTRGRVNLTNYSASKAALNSVVESQSEQLAQKSIFLNAIIPEKINTPLIQKLHGQNINKRELLEPKEVLEAIIKYSTTTEYGKLVHLRKGL